MTEQGLGSCGSNNEEREIGGGGGGGGAGGGWCEGSCGLKARIQVGSKTILNGMAIPGD